MKPAAFQYHAPKTLDEAVTLIGQVAPEDGRVLAGGQSLVPTMAFRMARPAHLVDINGVAGLDVSAAANASLQSAPACAMPPSTGLWSRGHSEPALLVVQHIAHYPIRTRGTFCGSLAHADPASEWCLVAVTLGATDDSEKHARHRELAADDFFEGFMTTNLAEDELLVRSAASAAAPDTRFGFYEFSRRAGDYAIAMSLVTYRFITAPSPMCVGVGGAEGVPRRFAEAEAALSERYRPPKHFAAAGEAAAAAVDPMEDLQANAKYRRDLVRTVTRRALERAAA